MKTMRSLLLLAVCCLLAGCVSFSSAKSHLLSAQSPQWVEHEAYLAHFRTTVRLAMERQLAARKIIPLDATYAQVSFVLNDGGYVSRVTRATGSGDRAFIELFVTTLTSGNPYTPWTESMRAALGAEQPFTFTYYYGPKPPPGAVQ